MSTSIKRQGLHAMNVEESTLTNLSSLEKHQDSLQEQVLQPTYPSQSSHVKNVETLTENFYQKKFNPSTDSYWGLHIYDLEDSE
jgi:hypothetical protein